MKPWKGRHASPIVTRQQHKGMVNLSKPMVKINVDHPLVSPDLQPKVLLKRLPDNIGSTIRLTRQSSALQNDPKLSQRPVVRLSPLKGPGKVAIGFQNLSRDVRQATSRKVRFDTDINDLPPMDQPSASSNSTAEDTNVFPDSVADNI